MKKILLACLLVISLCLPALADDFKTEEERLGYAIGMNIGTNMKQQQVGVDPEQVAAGLVSSFKGEETLLTLDEMGQVLMAFQQRMQMEALQKQAENVQAVNDFMKENASKEGIVTLDSGLQYKVLSSGSGQTPTAESTVEVHYMGTLIDGTEFDSSYKRGQPAQFPVNGVIAGWTEALQLMKEGDKWQLFIPPSLGYGERGAGAAIPPNSALIFEVELLKVL